MKMPNFKESILSLKRFLLNNAIMIKNNSGEPVIKLLFATLFLFLTLEARENPFFPSEGEKDIPFTSNQDNSVPQLKRATITLPPHARVLKKVTIEFKNLDGSIEKKSVELNNAVDWHLPVFISQSYAQEKINKKVPKKIKSYKKVGSIKGTQFFTSKNNLKIITKDKILRKFLLVQPHRIVIDFKRDSNMKTYIKKIPNSVFTKIRVGNHNGYYRAVIELDGYYRYKFSTQKNGYLITLH